MNSPVRYQPGLDVCSNKELIVSVDIKTLFEAGAHFGHKTSRWHPMMEPYIHSAKSGVHIIDLNKTQRMLDEALAAIEDMAAKARPVLLVGTKRQASQMIEEAAKETGMPYVSVRWFGGMLTNFKTMQERIKRLKDLETRMESGELASRYNKLEVQRFQEEIDTLKHNFGGIQDLDGMPGAIFIADVVTEDNAVKEANKLSVPVIGIVDTNADPTNIDYPIPANDDAIKTLKLIIDEVASAIKRGQGRAKDEAVQAIKQAEQSDSAVTEAKSTKPVASSPKNSTVAKPTKTAKSPSKSKPQSASKTTTKKASR